MKNGKMSFVGWFYSGVLPLIFGFFLWETNKVFSIGLFLLGIGSTYLAISNLLSGLETSPKTTERKLAFSDEELGLDKDDEGSFRNFFSSEGSNKKYPTWDENNNNLHF